MTKQNSRHFLLITAFSFFYSVSVAQENYEIQVYSSETTEKGTTVVELHSNFTFQGTTEPVNGVLPTYHILHETVEITHGFTDWFEVGFYFFNAFGDNHRSGYVGSHIRPRVAAPEKWHLPVGLSLSAEVGYQQLQYSEDDWSLELRPIIDKKLNNLYLSFNPVFGKSFHGLNQNSSFDFSPNFKMSYAFNNTLAPGIEYYGSLGAFGEMPDFDRQQHSVFITLDFLSLDKWELNLGYGAAITDVTDNSIVKIIWGRKF